MSPMRKIMKDCRGNEGEIKDKKNKCLKSERKSGTKDVSKTHKKKLKEQQIENH